MQDEATVAWSGGVLGRRGHVTIRLFARIPSTSRCWGQSIEIERSRLERHPALFGQVVDRMVRDIEARL